eukprot:XP_011682258.1 PREDICTED: ADP-ribosyl cyclase isoform X1 [Strongylocentrotus purpuratus]
MPYTAYIRRRIFGVLAATIVVMTVIENASTMMTTRATMTTLPPVLYSDNGTDIDLREIFIGRCADFKAGRVNPTVDLNELRMKNCTHLWNLFHSTFKYREACNVTRPMYKEFVAEATITIPHNKSAFWDGWTIYDTVHSYAKEGRRSWSLEYTLMGYLINNLKFCGQEAEPGLRYDSCPGPDECGFAKGCADAFWAEASINFAKQAKGQVRVFFDSNREGGAFHNNNSYFAQYELINMDPDAVENVNIYLVTELETNSGDNCTSPSIQELISILKEKNIRYTCYEQPRDVLHLLCIDGNESDECILQKDALVSPTDVALPLTTSSSSRTRNAISISFQVLIVIFVGFTHRVLHNT